MKALVTAASKSSDSLVKKKKQELQHQLYHEPRYKQVKALADDLELTSAAEARKNNPNALENNTDAVAALMSLGMLGPIILM
jgi:hypothetical protein